MSWCEFCVDKSGFFSTNYKCNISGLEKEIPNDYIKSYCMHSHYAYKCPYYQKYGPSTGGCFITTITCEILKKEDNNFVMESLRTFRNNFLQKNEEYFDILKLYDNIGPLLAEKIKKDENKQEIASTIYQLLENISNLVKKDKNIDAVEKYYLMTLMLINYYGMKHEFNDIVDKDYNCEEFNPKDAGHGIRYKKKNKTT